MDSSLQDNLTLLVTTSCNTGCRYAEPMHDDYADWIWCTRPEASVRVHQLGGDCRRLEPANISHASTAH